MRSVVDSLAVDWSVPVRRRVVTDFVRDDRANFGEESGHAGNHVTSAIEYSTPDAVLSEPREIQTRRGSLTASRCAYFDEFTE